MAIIDSKPSPKQTRPELLYLTPAGPRATQYEEVTLHTQWSPSNYAVQGWFSRGRGGRPPWSEESTRLRCRDWWRYRDPAQRWFRNYAREQASAEEAIETASAGAQRMGLMERIDRAWLGFLGLHYAAYRFPEYGLFLALCHAQREALSDVTAGPLVFQSLDKDRHSQAIALYMMDLEAAVADFAEGGSKRAWMGDAIWQPMRRYVEELIACRDWAEIAFAVNLLHEPAPATLFTRELAARRAPFHGDPVTPAILSTVESDRATAVGSVAEIFRCAIEDTPSNREVVGEWVERWAPRAIESACALKPLFDDWGADFDRALERLLEEQASLMGRAGAEPAALARML